MENEELLRWAAEDVLGWRRISGRYLAWRDADDDFLRPHDLVGWEGFALAAKVAVDRGLVAIVMRVGDWYSVYISGRDGMHKDPGLAMWTTLRQVLNGK